MSRPARDPLDRFHEKYVHDHATGCMIWTGARNGKPGYGTFKSGDGKMVLAHRFSYEAFVAPIPAGLVIDHLCRNRRCINPEHLRCVTAEQNLKAPGSLSLAARSSWTHCSHGHEFTEANTYIKANGCRMCRTCSRSRYVRKAVAA